MANKIIYNPPQLTVYTLEGGVYQGEATMEQVLHLVENPEMLFDDILKMFIPKEKLQEVADNKELIESVVSDDRFFYENDALYRVGIPISIPQDLAEKFKLYIEFTNRGTEEEKKPWQEKLDALDNFWKWTSLIRKPSSRESFYTFISKNNIIITKEGFVVVFRRAEYKGKNVDLVKFITSEYTRLRKNKKSTNISVFSNGYEYSLKENLQYQNTEIGILKDLYHSFESNSDVFESTTRGVDGKPLTYVIGQETRMSVDEVDWSNAECSRGIHCSSGGYNFSGYGNTPLACVLNPSNVVYCPYSDTSKMRVLALTPIAALENDCDFTLSEEHEAIITDLFERDIDNLQNLLLENNFEEATKQSILTTLDIQNIFTTITQTNQEVVKNRYTKL